MAGYFSDRPRFAPIIFPVAAVGVGFQKRLHIPARIHDVISQKAAVSTVIGV